MSLGRAQIPNLRIDPGLFNRRGRGVVKRKLRQELTSRVSEQGIGSGLDSGIMKL